MRHIALTLAWSLAFASTAPAQLALGVAAVDGGAVASGRRLALTATTPDRTVSGLTPELPSVWIDRYTGAGPSLSDAACQARVDGFKQDLAFNAPVVDLNLYHVVTLSDNGVITVLDPRNGFGGSRMVARVDLEGEPGDWVYDEAARQLWVAIPSRTSVVALDAHGWRVVREVRLEAAPTALSVDGNVLWVTSGASVVRLDRQSGERLSVESLAEPVTALTLAGDVPLAVAGGRLWLRHGDAWSVSAVADVKTMVWSELAGAVVVALEGGAVAVVEPSGHVRSTAPAASPADTRLSISPDGRWVFAWSPHAADIRVFDVSRGDWRGELKTNAPTELAFSDDSLFVRTATRSEVLVTPIAAFEAPGAVAGKLVSGGTRPHVSTARRSMATLTGSGVVFWASGADGQVFVYHEGMNAASGTLRHPGIAPRDVLVAGPPLRRVSPGRFTAEFSLPTPGRYLVAAFSRQPLTTACRVVEVGGELPAEQQPVVLRLIDVAERGFVGRPLPVAVEVAAPPSHLPDDLSVLLMSASGTWQQRYSARAVDATGRYEVEVIARQPGPHYLVVTITPTRGRPRVVRRVVRFTEAQ